jgi:membrane-bound lytic murein transglycosylase D
MNRSRSWLTTVTAAGVCAGIVACGSANPKPQAPAAAAVQSPAPAVAAPAPAPRPAPVLDPITTLIEASQHHFETGERELKAGHLDRAREAFDSAVQVLLESPYGARSDARLREHFDRLIDRINA